MNRLLFADAPLVQQMLELSPAAVAVVDDNGTIQFVNQNFTDLLGFSSDEILGQSCMMILPGTLCCDVAFHDAHLFKNARVETHCKNKTVYARAKYGSDKRVTLSVHEISSSGIALRVFNLEVENHLLFDTSQIESERLSAVAQMVSGLAHESRNALQKAVACLDLLELDIKSNKDLMLLANQIRESLADLLENYDEVRRYAAPIQLTLEPAKLMSLCRDAFNEMSVGQVGIAHELVFLGTPDNEPWGVVDRQRMKDVFSHLLGNAIDAADGPALIEVTCENIIWRTLEAVTLSLHDYGSGFSVQALDRAFEPFFTTKLRGTGLGLSACRRIVETHHGEIVASNDARGGAVLCLTIPLDPRKS